MTKPPQVADEVCASCGEFVVELNERTGWCYDCSPSVRNSINLVAVSRIERWLTRYADTVEFVMQEQRITAKLAIIEVHATYKATCIICHEPIKHGTHGRHFLCNSTLECRKARRRYKYLIYDKGLTKEAALAAITPQEK